MLATPVLLLLFNRPDLARKSFAQIRKVEPRQLFIAADGPRPDRPDDVENCAATRAIVNQVDWECEVKTLFREQNRGCGYGPAEAISWFFEHVELGIILEDDCVADVNFFPFCEELLDKYRYDETVSMISGTNPSEKWRSGRSSYVFSNLGFSWGWASWRRAWEKFEYDATRWATPEGKLAVKKYLNNDAYFRHYTHEFDYYFSEIRSDVWDFQWLFSRFYHHSCTIVPTVNLVTNIGFGIDATHTFDADANMAYLPLSVLKLPLEHPREKKIDRFFDWYLFERFLNHKKRSLVKKVGLKVMKRIVLSELL